MGRDLAIFAILHVGGFIGPRAHLVAVPFKMLVIDEARLRVRLPGATRKAQEILPEFCFPADARAEKF